MVLSVTQQIRLLTAGCRGLISGFRAGLLPCHALRPAGQGLSRKGNSALNTEPALDAESALDGKLITAVAGGSRRAEDLRRPGPVLRVLIWRRVHAIVVQVVSERSLAKVEVSPGVSHDELVPEGVAPVGLRDKWDLGVSRVREQEGLELR
jgi:hypothetical protein